MTREEKINRDLDILLEEWDKFSETLQKKDIDYYEFLAFLMVQVADGAQRLEEDCEVEFGEKLLRVFNSARCFRRRDDVVH